MNTESFIKRRLWQFFLAFTLILLVLARQVVVGALSPEAMATTGFVLAAAGFVFLVYSFREARNKYKHEQLSGVAVRNKLVKSIRGLQVWLGFLVFGLVMGLAQMRGEPLLPTLIGITVNLSLQLMLFSALRTQKMKLRQLDSLETSLIDNATTYPKADTQ